MTNEEILAELEGLPEPSNRACVLAYDLMYPNDLRANYAYKIEHVNSFTWIFKLAQIIERHYGPFTPEAQVFEEPEGFDPEKPVQIGQWTYKLEAV